jgi:hypothetical protein
MCNTRMNGVHFFLHLIRKDVDFSNAAIDAPALENFPPKSIPRIMNEQLVCSSPIVPTNVASATLNVNALATLQDDTVATVAALSVIQNDSAPQLRLLQRRMHAAVTCRCRLDAVTLTASRVIATDQPRPLVVCEFILHRVI